MSPLRFTDLNDPQMPQNVSNSNYITEDEIRNNNYFSEDFIRQVIGSFEPLHPVDDLLREIREHMDHHFENHIDFNGLAICRGGPSKVVIVTCSCGEEWRTFEEIVRDFNLGRRSSQDFYDEIGILNREGKRAIKAHNETFRMEKEKERKRKEQEELKRIKLLQERELDAISCLDLEDLDD